MVGTNTTFKLVCGNNSPQGVLNYFSKQCGISLNHNATGKHTVKTKKDFMIKS